MSRLAVVSLALVCAGTRADTIEAPRPSGWRLMRAPVESVRPLPPVPELVAKLDSPKYLERVSATNDLARSGKDAIPALKTAALSEQPEVSLRAVIALENLWHIATANDDLATEKAALVAFDELSLAGTPLQRRRLESLFSLYRSAIEKFAVGEILRLGGGVRYQEGIGIVDDNGAIRPQIEYVVIGPQWTGGEAGLRYLRHLAGQSLIVVYFIQGVELPDGALERFQTVAPANVRADRRGTAYLGVKSSGLPNPGGGVVVGIVQPGTPADKADLRSGDVILEFGGVAIVDWDWLVGEIAKAAPGQTIDAAVLRNGEILTQMIVMEAWQ